MTDRYNALTVVLSHDIRSDDAEPLIAAIKQMRYVISVTGEISDTLTQEVAESRIRLELREKVSGIIFPRKAK